MKCLYPTKSRTLPLTLGLALATLICGKAQTVTNTPTPPADATANSDAVPKLTLADVKNLAFERNWNLLATRTGVDAATAQLLVVKEFPNPTLSLSTAKIGESEAGTVAGNGVWARSYDSIAAVSQLIEIGGKRHDRQMAARAGVLGAKARFFDAKRTLDQGVTKAYIAALLAEENVRMLEQSASYLRHEAAIAEDQRASGDLSDADTKTIEINAEQFALQAKAAEATAVQARIAVELLIGINHPMGNWAPSDSLPEVAKTLPTESETESNMTSTNAERPDVLAAETDLRSAVDNLKLQKAERIPDPTFSIGVEHEPPGYGPDVNTVNIGVSFPLPLWNLNGGNIHAAQASVQQYKIALAQLQAQAAADLANARSEYDEAYARWVLYRDQTVPKSAQAREAFEFKYQKGAATLVDLLNAEQTDNSIRLAYAQAMNDTASAAADLSAARQVVSETEVNSENFK